MSAPDPTRSAAVDPSPGRIPAGLTTGQLEIELLGMAGHIAAAQCRFLQLLAEFDRRGGWAGPGLKSCAHWLCWRIGLCWWIGMGLRTAAEHVRVAHALGDLPAITDAVAAGRISYSKVRAITLLTGQNSATGAAEEDGPVPPPGNGDDSRTADGQRREPDRDPYSLRAAHQPRQPRSHLGRRASRPGSASRPTPPPRRRRLRCTAPCIAREPVKTENL